MKLKKTLLLVAAFAAFGSSAAHALTFKDVDLDGFGSYRYLSSWGTSSYSSTFNIIDDGYDPLTMQVDSAWASFAFADDWFDSGEWVDIELAWSPFITGEEVDGSIWSYDWVSGSITGSFLAELQDGILEYKVEVTSGDTYLKETKLLAHASYKSVPDGGSTAALLGLGLLACVALKRRK